MALSSMFADLLFPVFDGAVRLIVLDEFRVG